MSQNLIDLIQTGIFELIPLWTVEDVKYWRNPTYRTRAADLEYVVGSLGIENQGLLQATVLLFFISNNKR